MHSLLSRICQTKPLHLTDSAALSSSIHQTSSSVLALDNIHTPKQNFASDLVAASFLQAAATSYRAARTHLERRT